MPRAGDGAHGRAELCIGVQNGADLCCNSQAWTLHPRRLRVDLQVSCAQPYRKRGPVRPAVHRACCLVLLLCCSCAGPAGRTHPTWTRWAERRGRLAPRATAGHLTPFSCSPYGHGHGHRHGQCQRPRPRTHERQPMLGPSQSRAAATGMPTRVEPAIRQSAGGFGRGCLRPHLPLPAQTSPAAPLKKVGMPAPHNQQPQCALQP